MSDEELIGDKETIREDSDAVIRRLKAEIERERLRWREEMSMKTTLSIIRTERLQEYILEPKEVHKRRVGVIELTDEEYKDFVVSKEKYEDWQHRLDAALDGESG